MRKVTNMSFGMFTLALVFSAGLACKTFSKPASSDNTITSGNTTVENRNSSVNAVNRETTSTVPTTKEPKIEQADFTLTAEDLDKEYTKKGVTDKDLEKYAKKNIAVSGRVSMLVLEKNGTTQPWVTLFAPGVLHGVSCYFDDDNLEQMKKLKMDKIVTVQGFQDDFIVPEISPRLEHCVVIKAD